MDTNQIQKHIFSQIVRTSQIFKNFEDEDMTDFIITQNINQQAEDAMFIIQENKLEQKEQEKQKQKQKQKQSNENKHPVTRLQLEVEKNNLLLEPLFGQLFILLCPALLIGDKKHEEGKMMLTNYRLLFFKGSKRRVNVPFGYISNYEFVTKNMNIIVHLKYPHLWKFQLFQQKNFNDFKTYSFLYLRSNEVRSSFAFAYALKCPDKYQRKYSHAQEYLRIGITNNQNYKLIDNSSYNICLTYPSQIYTESKISQNQIIELSKHRNMHRLPIITYIYKNIQKQKSILWRASNYIDDYKTISIKTEREILKTIGNTKLVVFSTSPKSSKDEQDFYEECQMHYLKTQSLNFTKQSYFNMVSTFLSPKKQFCKSILSSKWYYHIGVLLDSAAQVANKILNGSNVLVKCLTGVDRSAEITALTMLILDPYYRTFQGFQSLVEKQFVELGHPFASRLGHKLNGEQNPIFIQFLDAVSQLLYFNPMSFQFNHKFLSKLSNLIYMNIYGNFIADSEKQIISSKIKEQTIPVWRQISNQLTTNAFYQTKQGLLEIKHNISSLRLWKQHFWYLTTSMKDSYRLHPLAEDNYDYITLQCLKKKVQNDYLKNKVSSQKKQIQKLKQKLASLKSPKN